MSTNGNRHTRGALDALERQDREQLAQTRRHAQFDEACGKARSAGFTAAQVPFAAMAALTMSALNGPPPSREMIRRRVEAQYPFLFSDDEGGGEA